MGLDRFQTEPFTQKRTANWMNEYERGVNEFRMKFMTPYYANPEQGYMGADTRPRFTDKDLAAWGEEFQDALGGKGRGSYETTKNGVQGPYGEAGKLNQKLRFMEFLAKYGPYLSDPSKVSDDMIAKAGNLDVSSMNPAMRRQVLSQIRGLDYQSWTQTFTPEKAPFSTARYYGTTEAYNATLERPEGATEVRLITGKLDAVVSAVESTITNNNEQQKAFEDSLNDIIRNATQPIVDEIRGLQDIELGGFPSTDV